MQQWQVYWWHPCLLSTQAKSPTCKIRKPKLDCHIRSLTLESLSLRHWIQWNLQQWRVWDRDILSLLAWMCSVWTLNMQISSSHFFDAKIVQLISKRQQVLHPIEAQSSDECLCKKSHLHSSRRAHLGLNSFGFFQNLYISERELDVSPMQEQAA